MKEEIAVKPEGCEVELIGMGEDQSIPEIPTMDLLWLDSEMRKVELFAATDDKVERELSALNEFVENNFIIGDSGNGVLAPNGEPYKTYAAKVVLTREVLLDIGYERNLINLAKLFFIKCANNTFKKILSGHTEKPTISWRCKPEFSVADDYLFGYDLLAIFFRMRLLVY